MIAVAAGCSCKKTPETPPEGDVMPSIPEGITLNPVADGDIAATLESFSVKYQNSQNIYIDFFKSYSTEGSVTSVRAIRYEGKIFGDNASCENYKNALGDVTAKSYFYRTYQDGITEEEEDISTLKLRGEKCSVVSDGYTKKRGGSVIERGSGLTGMYIEGYHGNEAPMDYMLERYGYGGIFSEELENIANFIAEEQSYSAEVKADDTKLFLFIYRNAENNSPVYCFYLDTAAANSADSFDKGGLEFVQTADVLYYSLDREEFLRDFMDNKAITLKPYGNGLNENIGVLGGYFDIQFIYGGKTGNTNLNVGFSNGEIYFPENAFKVFCGKVDSENFDMDKLTLFYFTIKATYNGTGTAGGVTERKECVTEILIDY